jgi:hypothetical protein
VTSNVAPRELRHRAAKVMFVHEYRTVTSNVAWANSVTAPKVMFVHEYRTVTSNVAWANSVTVPRKSIRAPLANLVGEALGPVIRFQWSAPIHYREQHSHTAEVMFVHQYRTRRAKHW